MPVMSELGAAVGLLHASLKADHLLPEEPSASEKMILSSPVQVTITNCQGREIVSSSTR